MNEVSVGVVEGRRRLEGNDWVRAEVVSSSIGSEAQLSV